MTLNASDDTAETITPYKPRDNTGISFKMWRKFFLNRSPRYWALGVVLLFCRLLALLPHSILLRLGAGFGHLIGWLSPRVRGIACVNIQLCYPELTSREQEALVKASFRELGITFAETFKSWFGNVTKLYWPSATQEGLEHWRAALASERGIILMACHFGSPDLNVALVGSLVRKDRTFVFTYRKPSDSIVDAFICDARGEFGDHLFPVNNLVGITRALKKKGVVWYAPDIEVKNKNSVFAEFKGVQASTTLAISRIARATNALVVPYAHYRNDDDRTYRLRIFPALDNFPSDEPIADTRALNRAIEAIIEPHPERYWWSIKRFKNRPEGEKKVY